MTVKEINIELLAYGLTNKRKWYDIPKFFSILGLISCLPIYLYVCECILSFYNCTSLWSIIKERKPAVVVVTYINNMFTQFYVESRAKYNAECTICALNFHN